MQLKFTTMQMRLHAPAKPHSAGFTLLELMIVIILMAGISLAVFYSARHAIDKINYERSQVMVQNLAKAIDLYAQETNRYPCPARTDLARTNANYGREDCGVAGITRVNSSRAIATYPKKPVEITAVDQNQVLIGNLPIYVQNASNNWVALGSYVPAIKKEGSNLLLDPTGNPPLYAVAKKLTDREVAAGANQGVALADYGNIAIVNEGGMQLSGVNNDARFVIIAQTYRNGGCVVNRIDYDNCDIVFDSAPENKADDKFVIAPRALSTLSNDYYDDVVLFNNNIPDQKWLTNDNVEITNNIKNWIIETRGLAYMNANNNNVGIATNTPTEKLDVGGTLRAEMNIRGSLICDKPAQPDIYNSTNVTYEYRRPYINLDDIVVTKQPAGGAVTTLVRGTHYTVDPFNVTTGIGRITLVTAPVATDTITIVKKELCLDPLTVVKRFDYAGVYNDKKDSLSCPSGDEISTSGILSGLPAVGDASWNRTSTGSCNKPPEHEELCADSGIPGDKRNILRMGIMEPDPNMRTLETNYWQLQFHRSSYTKSTGKYGMDRPGQKIILYKDNGDTHGAGVDLDSRNALEFEIIGSKSRFKYENPGFGNCAGGNAAGPASDTPQQASARACRGWHTNCVSDPLSTNVCSYNPEMHIILVRPLNGTPFQQNAAINFRIQRIGQYLAGTTIDKNGVMRPICKNLEISPIAFRNEAERTNTCPANQKLRGIQTDGKAICALD